MIAATVSFVTPLGAVVALAALVPLGVVLVSRSRLRALCDTLGLEPPPAGRVLVTLGALAALAGVLALAAAGPVVARRTAHTGREDAEAYFVLDVSRSMAARTPSSPTRLDRARADAKRLRSSLGDLPVGVASLTDRLLPHLFPSVSANAFAATIDEALAIDRPPTSFDYGDTLGTKLSALADLVGGRYFRAQVERRFVVVFTDGETRLDDLSILPARFRDGRLHVLFFRYWDAEERVYDAPGRPNPVYHPDSTSAETLADLAGAVSARVYREGETDAAAARIRTLAGSGPTIERGRELDSFLLTPYVLLAGLVPLLVLLRDVRPRRE